MERGQDAEPEAQRRGEDQAGRCQEEREGIAGAKVLGDGPVVLDRPAEVAAGELPDVLRVLDGDGAVPAELPSHALDRRAVGRLPHEHDLDGIPRHQDPHQEHEERDDRNDRHDGQEPADDERTHGARRHPGGAAPRTRAARPDGRVTARNSRGDDAPGLAPETSAMVPPPLSA